MRLAVIRRTVTMEDVFEVSVVDEEADDENHFDDADIIEAIAIESKDCEVPLSETAETPREAESDLQNPEESDKVTSSSSVDKMTTSTSEHGACEHCGCGSKSDKATVASEAAKETSDINSNSSKSNSPTVSPVLDSKTPDVLEEEEINVVDDEADENVPQADVTVTPETPEVEPPILSPQTPAPASETPANSETPGPSSGMTVMPKWRVRPEELGNNTLNNQTLAERAKAIKRGFDGTVDPWCSKRKKATLLTREGPVDVSLNFKKAKYVNQSWKKL